MREGYYWVCPKSPEVWAPYMNEPEEIHWVIGFHAECHPGEIWLEELRTWFPLEGFDVGPYIDPPTPRASEDAAY